MQRNMEHMALSENVRRAFCKKERWHLRLHEYRFKQTCLFLGRWINFIKQLPNLLSESNLVFWQFIGETSFFTLPHQNSHKVVVLWRYEYEYVIITSKLR